MKRVQIASAGGYEKLKFIELPTPTPQDHEVLIEVKGIGVNYADTLVRLGVYSSAKHYIGWPITPGFEVSGRVVKTGSKVKKFKVGDEVMGFTRFFGYSTELCIHEDHVMRLPKGFDLYQAAGFPAVFMTAYYALKQIMIFQPGSKLLIHSAAGGVGSALVQIAKAEGHYVVGVVGSSHKVDYVKKLGADVVLDKSTDPDIWKTQEKMGLKKAYDGVFDANGYTTYGKSYEFLRPTGKLVIYGSHSLLSKKGGRINWPHLIMGYLKTKRYNPFDLITDNKSIVAFNVSYLFEETAMVRQNLEGLMELAEKGLIYPPETTYIDFDHVAEAHKLIESGSTRGKIVLRT